MRCVAHWSMTAYVDEPSENGVEVEFTYRGKGRKLHRIKLFENAVRALRKWIRTQPAYENVSVQRVGEILTGYYLDFIWTEVGQVIQYEEHLLPPCERQAKLTNATQSENDMATKKSKTAKKSVKKTSVKKSRASKPSITLATYTLMHKFGPDNVTVAQATELAKQCKPDTKFNAWHLYFHRKNYRVLDLNGELDEKIAQNNPELRRMIGSLKHKANKPGSKAAPKKAAKSASKKRTVRIKLKRSKK